MTTQIKKARILLVEDNDADVELIKEAFYITEFPNELNVVESGEKALDYVYQRGDFSEASRPDMILLDLGLPGISGHDVLETIKADDEISDIPVIILSGSDAATDVQATYRKHANSYVVKPVDFRQFIEVVRNIQEFWLQIVRLPSL